VPPPLPVLTTDGVVFVVAVSSVLRDFFRPLAEDLVLPKTSVILSKAIERLFIPSVAKQKLHGRSIVFDFASGTYVKAPPLSPHECSTSY